MFCFFQAMIPLFSTPQPPQDCLRFFHLFLEWILCVEDSHRKLEWLPKFSMEAMTTLANKNTSVFFEFLTPNLIIEVFSTNADRVQQVKLLHLLLDLMTELDQNQVIISFILTGKIWSNRDLILANYIDNLKKIIVKQSNDQITIHGA